MLAVALQSMNIHESHWNVNNNVITLKSPCSYDCSTGVQTLAIYRYYGHGGHEHSRASLKSE